MMNARKWILVAVAGAALTQAQLGFSGITGTKHDLSTRSWNTTKTLCGVCHTPHNANSTVAAPLWDHTMSAVASYGLYSSSTLNGAIAQPGAYSKICLSCHDGTVALENFGGVTTGTNYIAATANVGTNFSNDHPIGVDYTAASATADGDLYNPTTQAWGGTPAGTIQAMMLFTNKIECASCHQVHDNTYAPFLRKSNASSALCLTCHNK